MTHEETAREIVENKEIWYWLRGHLCIEKEGDRIINLAKSLISEALASAEKKGREEGKIEGMAFWWKARDKGWNSAKTPKDAIKGAMKGEWVGMEGALDNSLKEPEINQCDGCRRGLPLKDGIHYVEGEVYDKIACTKAVYEKKEPECKHEWINDEMTRYGFCKFKGSRGSR